MTAEEIMRRYDEAQNAKTASAAEFEAARAMRTIKIGEEAKIEVFSTGLNVHSHTVIGWKGVDMLRDALNELRPVQATTK